MTALPSATSAAHAQAEARPAPIWPAAEANQGLISLVALFAALFAALVIFALERSTEGRRIKRQNAARRKAAVFATRRALAVVTSWREAQVGQLTVVTMLENASLARRAIHPMADLLHTLAHGSAAEDTDAAVLIARARGEMMGAIGELQPIANDRVPFSPAEARGYERRLSEIAEAIANLPELPS